MIITHLYMFAGIGPSRQMVKDEDTTCAVSQLATKTLSLRLHSPGSRMTSSGMISDGVSLAEVPTQPTSPSGTCCDDNFFESPLFAIIPSFIAASYFSLSFLCHLLTLRHLKYSFVVMLRDVM